MLTLGVAGYAHTGADVPGFFGKPTDELFIRFYQLGAVMPLMRAHSHIENPDREPWF